MKEPASTMGMRRLALWAAIALVAGCAQHAAPVRDRGAPTGAVGPTVIAPAPTAPVAAKRVATDGVYIVQPGDTLYSIALEFGVDRRDVAQWNNIADGISINVGQPLRVAPPASAVAVAPIAPSGATETRPLPPTGTSGPIATIPVPGAPVPAPATPAIPDTGPVATLPAAPPVPEPPPAPEPARPAAVRFEWPAPGKVIETFDDPRSKGIGIAGAEGAPVLAAADGEVVYVGSAVRGYGNLVIVRHGADFITAYAHNRKILVQEKQQVKRGQTIAELGKSDTDRPKLHFEIRHQGKPVDPLKHLPAR